jgi:hypothetical protein
MVVSGVFEREQKQDTVRYGQIEKRKNKMIWDFCLVVGDFLVAGDMARGKGTTHDGRRCDI